MNKQKRKNIDKKLNPIFIEFIKYLIYINKYEFKQSDFREFIINKKKKYSSLYEELLENGKIDITLNSFYQKLTVLSTLINKGIISILKERGSKIFLINVDLFETYLYLEKESIEILNKNNSKKENVINKDYNKQRLEKIKQDLLLADSFEKKQIDFLYKACFELNSAQSFKKFNIDHVISIFYCIKHNLIAHRILNLQILTKSDNNSKLTNSNHFFSERFTLERQIAYVKSELSFYLEDNNVSFEQKKKIEKALDRFEVYMEFAFLKL